MLDLEEKLLAYETGAPQPSAFDDKPAAFEPMPALSEYPSLGSAETAAGGGSGEEGSKAHRQVKKLNRAYRTFCAVSCALCLSVCRPLSLCTQARSVCWRLG